MKCAVVLQGYFDTVSVGKVDAGYNSHRLIKNFFKDHDVDYYIHSWQPDKYHILKDLYDPVKIKTESQIDFLPIMKKHGISQEWFDEGFDRKSTPYNRIQAFKTISFSYSRSESLKLFMESNMNYDWVFIMRLDIGNVGGADHNFPHKFKFDSDNSKIYSPYWNQLNCGLGDMWFVTNTHDAHIMSSVYDSVLEAYKPNSDYCRLMTEGWPDSEWFDFGVAHSSDPRQFSNVVLSGKKSKKLMTYPRWYCINGHAFYKYFFMKTGLYTHTLYI